MEPQCQHDKGNAEKFIFRGDNHVRIFHHIGIRPWIFWVYCLHRHGLQTQRTDVFLRLQFKHRNQRTLEKYLPLAETLHD